jgi:predicted nucleic acid-binding protein
VPRGETALCDTGPLVALFDVHDAQHFRCRAALEEFDGNLVTAWPVLTEAFHFLNPGPVADRLWSLISKGGFILPDLTPADWPRLRALMTKYADLPMELADASLVVLAERLNLRRILTLDRRHFSVYRPRHIHSFEIFP